MPRPEVRQHMVCDSVFLQGASVQPPPGLLALTLPGGLIVLLRRGLLRELASAAREVTQAAARGGYERDAARYLGPLGRLDTIRGLLGLLGWESQPGEPEPVTVYLDQYRGVLLGAARNEHANQTRRARRACSKQARAKAQASRALLERLLEAIGGTL
ncbi:MAG TPA: hypothetical protein VK756_02230 [Solirubrobacteraceae bacterium]|nr:hypothetical protein [Solirubrobacteraceae bacterium]